MLEPASKNAHFTLEVYSFIFWVSLAFFFLIVGLMVFFIIKYRYKENRKTPHITHNHALEILWTVGPIPFLCVMFFLGYKGFLVNHKITQSYSEKTLDVYVTGHQWYWEFEYPNGTLVSNVPSFEHRGKEFYQEKGKKIKTKMLTLPVNTKVRLNISASDVLHSFAVPAFAIKKDAIPGQIRTIEFIPTKEGKFLYTCNEMCGTSHSQMMGFVQVVEQKEFEQFLVDNKPSKDPLVLGKDLYNKCAACHSLEKETDKIGPTWYGLFPKDGSYRKREIIDNDTGQIKTITLDENYIIRSIRNPSTEISIREYGSQKGKPYPNIMNAFNLKDDEIKALIIYIKNINQE